jgi:hypothetical protein
VAFFGHTPRLESFCLFIATLLERFVGGEWKMDGSEVKDARGKEVGRSEVSWRLPNAGLCTRGMTRINLRVSLLLRLPHTTTFSSIPNNFGSKDGVHVAPPIAAPEQRTQP